MIHLLESTQQSTYIGSPLDAYFYEDAMWQNRIDAGELYSAWNLGPGFDEHYTWSEPP